ncbi:MAG: MFS transporter [Chloroflexota bacterium]
MTAADRVSARPARNAEAERARWVTLLVFATQALLFASWTAHIPLVKARLGLSDGDLGLSLFGAPIGSIAATLLASWLLPRLGSKRMIQILLVGYGATAWTVGVAGSGGQLFAALLIWGFFQGSLDVSMNAQAVFVERAVRRPIMSSFHGTWSIGAFVGASLGAVAVSLGVSLTLQMIVVAVVIVVGVGWASRVLLPDPPHDHPDGGRPSAKAAWLHPVVIALGLIVLASMLCEGSMADWSAVYLHDSLGTSPGFAALGYAAFSSTMVVQRLLGDRVLARLAPRTILPILALISTVGVGTALIVGNPVVSLVGFASLGLGLALVVPAAFSASGRLPGIHPGTAVAAVSAIGWVGFVAGPPLIGKLADAVTLPVALGVVPILTAVIAIAVRSSSAFGVAPIREEVAPLSP